MNRTAVFSKTGKGLLEIKNKANRLSKDQYRILNLVDGKANLLDLADGAQMSEIEARKTLASLSDSGYIKELTDSADTLSGGTLPPSTSYADDLDFTAILGPALSAKPAFYQSAALEQRTREEAERRTSEAAATRVREQSERRANEEAEDRAHAEATARKVREEAERRAREALEQQERTALEMRSIAENERKAKEEAERKAQQEKLEAERRAKEEAERRAKILAEARARVEADKRLREEEEERRKRDAAEKRRREEADKRQREEEEKRHREQEEKRRREEADKRRREEEEKRKRKEEEEEERQRKEEAARKLAEEQERLRLESEENQRREQEELTRRTEEQRRRLQADELQRLAEEEASRHAEQQRHQREEEERTREAKQREVEAARAHQEQERRRDEHRRREEDKQRQDDGARRRKEQDEGSRGKAAPLKAAVDDLPSLDMTIVPTSARTAALSGGFDADIEALKRAEAEVEREFQAKEAAIRSTLEEQERRYRLEDEARAAMDSAERDARERVERDARELTLAAEQARRGAEHKAREEAVRRAQEEKELRSKEREERRKQAEDNAKKRSRERREAEQRAREEELVRRRKEQEESDRRKAEIDRLQSEARRRAIGPGKIAAVVLVVLAVLAVGVVEVVPMSAYAPSIEKLASEALGEPVRVREVRASLFPSFHVELSKVTVGNAQDVSVGRAVAYLSLGSVFGERKVISRLVFDSVSAPQTALGRLSRWISTEGKPDRVALERVQFKDVKLEARGMDLPVFEADLLLAADRGVRGVTISTRDGRLTVEITPREEAVDVVARGRGFALPFGPPLEFTEFTAKGVARGNELKLSELEYLLYGGQGKGALNVSWGAVWNVDGIFDIQRVELEPAMIAMKVDIASDGILEAKGRFALQSVELERLFEAPQVGALFMVRKGNLAGLDLVRALQSPTRDGIAGGKTKFEELSGSLATSGGRMQFNGVKLAAGALIATGQGEVSENQDVDGKTYIELRSSANTIRGNFRVQGTLNGMVLRP